MLRNAATVALWCVCGVGWCLVWFGLGALLYFIFFELK